MNYDLKVLCSEVNFPEGPAFGPDGSIWAVEQKGGAIIRYQDGAMKRIATGGSPNGIVIDRLGQILFCDSGMNAIRLLDSATGKTKNIYDTVEGERLSKP